MHNTFQNTIKDENNKILFKAKPLNSKATQALFKYSRGNVSVKNGL